MNAKEQLRRAARLRRVELDQSVPDFASRLAAFAEEIPLPKDAMVAGYWPFSGEADARELMRALAARGHQLALPRISSKVGELVFRTWSPGDRLVRNRHGIGEPEEDKVAVHPDLILVPLLAFDAAGHRLGHGGGYYDRVLRERGPIAVGIAYAGQEVQTLPHEAHDRPLDFVVTEFGLRRFKSA